MLPLRLPGCFSDSRDLPLIGKLSEADAANAEISEISVRPPAYLASVVAAGGEFLLSLLLQDHRFFSHLQTCPFHSSLADHEGRSEKRKELSGLFVGFRRGADNDIHTADLVYLIIVNFRKYELFLYTDRIVASAVK